MTCVCGDGKLAAATETAQKRAFRQTCKTRFTMVQLRRGLEREVVIAASLDRDRALANCRQHVANRNPRADPVVQTKPHQTCRRENHRVVLPFVELSNPRVNVATQIFNYEIVAAIAS